MMELLLNVYYLVYHRAGHQPTLFCDLVKLMQIKTKFHLTFKSYLFKIKANVCSYWALTFCVRNNMIITCLLTSCITPN